MGAKRIVEPIQIIGSIYTVDATSACTVAVQTEGCNTRNDNTIIQEIGSTRVSEACAAHMMVVGQQHGEIAHNASLIWFSLGWAT
jgi:hypothetical protein